MAAESGNTPSVIIVGRIRRAHGVRGEVVVETMTGAPDAIFAAGARVLLGDTKGDVPAVPRELRVRGSRPFKAGRLVMFETATDRNVAEQLRDRYLLVPADEVGPPAEDEVFLHDLVGLTVEQRGTDVGEVQGYFDSPAGILLEIRTGDETVLMPYQLEFVRSIDLEARRLVVEAPEGLFETLGKVDGPKGGKDDGDTR